MGILAKTMGTLRKLITFAPATGGAPLVRGPESYNKTKTLDFTGFPYKTKQIQPLPDLRIKVLHQVLLVGMTYV